MWEVVSLLLIATGSELCRVPEVKYGISEQVIRTDDADGNGYVLNALYFRCAVTSTSSSSALPADCATAQDEARTSPKTAIRKPAIGISNMILQV